MINILLVINGNTGLQYHRQISPHIVLDEVTGSNQFNITSTSNIATYPTQKLKDIQIVYFLRSIGKQRISQDIVNYIKGHGCKVILDIDDNWNLPSDHGLFHETKKQQLKENTEDAIKAADLVITTTEYFNNIIKRINNQSVSIPNCIDKYQPQWNKSPINETITRFGWVGGVWHKPDIKLLERSMQYYLTDSSMTSTRMVLGGWSPNYEYDYYEGVLSCNGALGERYKRVEGTDYNNYGRIYDNIDVALVPLRDSIFSRCKSPLKLMEAGAKGRAVIASDVLPYSAIPKDCYYPIATHDNGKGWYKAMKLMHREKQMRIDYAHKLSEHCDKYFDARTWALKRAEIYKDLLK